LFTPFAARNGSSAAPHVAVSAAYLGMVIERSGAILSAAEPHRNAVVHYLYPARYLGMSSQSFSAPSSQAG
jgi:hypothetical protein